MTPEDRARTPLERVLVARGFDLPAGYARLAETVCASEGHLRKIAAGSRPPSRRLRRLLALALDVPESDLFNDGSTGGRT